MTDYKQADIAVVDFGFSEGGGYKKRPVLIISSDDYNRSRHEVTGPAAGRVCRFYEGMRCR